MLNKKDNLIIFVLCLIVISLGVLILLKNPADVMIVENKNINLNQNQNTNQQVKIIIDGVDVSNWNVYENEEYGYSIKYPTDWKANEYSNKTGGNFTKDNNKIIIGRGSSSEIHINDPFDEYIYIAGSGIQNHESLNSIEEMMTYSGIKGYRIKWNVSRGIYPDTISSEMIYFEAKKQGRFKNTKAIVVRYGSSPTDNLTKIFNIMIKTFDYIKQ